MSLQELLDESLATESNDVWEHERMATPARAFAVRLHGGAVVQRNSCDLDSLVVDYSYQVICQWNHWLADSGKDLPTASPSGVVNDEITVQIGGKWYWVYAVIDLNTMLLSRVEVFSRHGTDPVAAFLHQISEKHNL